MKTKTAKQPKPTKPTVQTKSKKPQVKMRDLKTKKNPKGGRSEEFPFLVTKRS